MSSDKLVFDLATELEGAPNIFIKKDFLNILDDMNGNYGSNQSTISTSQLSNSNKYLSYREAYLSVPLLLTLTPSAITATPFFSPAVAGSSADYAMGLKNWFGSVIHSLSVDMNGTTIIQQTPFCNMWNTFKLLTSLSYSDIATTGASIGFYPDDPLSWSYEGAVSPSGIGVCNNTNFTGTASGVVVSGVFNKYKSTNGNEGFLKRQTYINYDAEGDSGNGTYDGFLTNTQASNLWKNRVSTKTTGTASIAGCLQISVRATIYLKHLHSFFQSIPLLKGVYMKLTMNLNNSSTGFTSAGVADTNITLTSTSVPSGGVQPIMIASKIASNGNALPTIAGDYIASLSVGSTCLNATQKSLSSVATGQVGSNIFLYVPAYSFNPVFEQAYLSSPIKTINYTDIYQYQILGTTAGGTINSLLTNGLANVKSVLVIPFLSSIVPAGSGVGLLPVYQSPFDPAGCGCTSPLSLITNFNVVVSGQNTLYNTSKYSYELYNNQLYGANAVNGGLTDGLTSGLFDQLGFEMEYCYHYVDVSRMLPIEQSVPKSVQIVGQNTSAFPLTYFCFIEYGMSISIDVVSGARV